MIILNGKTNPMLYYYSHEKDCIIELPSNKADFENKKSSITYLVAGLGSVLTAVGTLLTHTLSGVAKHYISLAVPFVFLIVLAFALHSAHTTEKREEEHILKNGRFREDFSAEKAYRITKENNKLFVKAFFFSLLTVLFCAGGFVVYITGLDDDIILLLVSAIGFPAGINLLIRFKPIQRVKLLLYLKRKAQQER